MSELPAPAPFRLWQVPLQHDCTPAESACLSAAENARAARFVFERDRRRFVVTRCALRILLGRMLGLAPQSLKLEIDAQGKPRLQAPHTRSFNVSHSEDTALVAIAQTAEIGVDIEVHRALPDAKELALNNFSAQELGELQEVGSAGRLGGEQAFFRIWTRKEACLKALGTGLRVEPQSFTVGLQPQPRTVVFALQGRRVAIEVQSLLDGGGFEAALARQV